MTLKDANLPAVLQNGFEIKMLMPDGTVCHASVSGTLDYWILVGEGGYGSWWRAWGFQEGYDDVAAARLAFAEKVVGYRPSKGAWPALRSPEDLRKVIVACWEFALDRLGHSREKDAIVPIEHRTRRLRI